MMDFSSELQRQRVLVRWKRQAARESELSIKDVGMRNKLLSRLIAYLQGDGSLVIRNQRNNVRYDILFYPDNLEVAHLIVDTFQKLYGRKPAINDEINHYRVRIVHKTAGEELNSLAKFSGLKWRLPYSVLINSECNIEWLRAFFDSEAYVGRNTVVANSVNESGLRQVKELLGCLGIQSRWYVYHRKQKNWNTNYILSINRKEDRQNFLKQVGFNHPAKQEKLINSLAGVA